MRRRAFITRRTKKAMTHKTKTKTQHMQKDLEYEEKN